MRKVLAASAVAIMVAFGLALTAAPASADPGGNPMWAANGTSEINSNGTATLTGGNTSVETTDAFGVLEVKAGTVLDLDYDLGEVATCTGGAPRVFATVDNDTVNSWDSHISEGVEAACKGSVTLPGGKLTKIGVVWDNGQTGSITATKLTLGDTELKFNDVTPLTEVDVTKLPEPKYTEPTCDANGSVVLPAKKKWPEGVKYTKIAGKGGDTVTVLVTALDGYKLSADKTFGPYAVSKLTANNCVVPEKPQSWDPTCDLPPRYQGDTDQVTYDNEGLPSGAGWYTVKATPKEGFKFKEGVTTEWRIDYRIPTGCDSTPSPEPSQSGGTGGGPGSPAPSTSNAGNDSGALPVTGPSGGPGKMIAMFGMGGLLVSIGGIMFVMARRRRDAEAVESAA